MVSCAFTFQSVLTGFGKETTVDKTVSPILKGAASSISS